ncbi:response regulator transcription factor [Shewanella sp. A14]
MNIINILLVDDHAVVREGLSHLIEQNDNFRVCAQAQNQSSALQALKQHQIDLAIVDLSLDDTNGLDLVKEILIFNSNIKVLVFSMHQEEIYAERALRAGAKGYLMKSESPETLIVAIRKLQQGMIYLSDRMMKCLLGDAIGRSKTTTSFGVQSLSNRELEIFTLIGKGYPSKEIAVVLGLSVKTVDAVRQNIKNKLGFHSASELVKFAIEHSYSI